MRGDSPAREYASPDAAPTGLAGTPVLFLMLEKSAGENEWAKNGCFGLCFGGVRSEVRFLFLKNQLIWSDFSV